MTTRAFDAVLFDMDGVVLDSTAIHGEVWVTYAREELGVEVTAHDPRLHGGKNPDIVEALTGRRPTAEEAARVHADKEARYRETARGRLRAIAGLARYLDRLRNAHVAVALVTSGDRVNVDFGLAEIALAGAFVVRVHGEDVANGKPHPEPFVTGAARLGVDPTKCLAHEDSITGVTSAVRARTTVAALTTTTSSRALLEAGARWALPDFDAWMRAPEFPF